MGKCTSKLITILQAVFRKLLVSFIIAICVTTAIYVFSNYFVDDYLYMYTYFIFILGGSTSLLSDLITWKLPLRRKRTVAAMIHIAPMFLCGSYYAFADEFEQFDMGPLFFICLIIALVFWIMDELIRFYQKNCDMCLKRVYNNINLKKAT
ncbi:hypothetical protein [Shimazuella kribbensis]|uniref:hypothetical protein n=1 Tax=Shimazuella kribbensis TaxID=139808 RepID=UPI00041A1E1F|nr:hypothetical protein [Shimazuella kribbensis]